MSFVNYCHNSNVIVAVKQYAKVAHTKPVEGIRMIG